MLTKGQKVTNKLGWIGIVISLAAPGGSPIEVAFENREKSWGFLTNGQFQDKASKFDISVI